MGTALSEKYFLFLYLILKSLKCYSFSVKTDEHISLQRPRLVFSSIQFLDMDKPYQRVKAPTQTSTIQTPQTEVTTRCINAHSSQQNLKFNEVISI